jgi:DNA-binding NarL/FixJ family response regulator
MQDSLRILIVEDEPLIAEDIADLCQLNGYTICGIAHRGGKALHLIESERPQLVLLDINLEDQINGLDIATFLREEYAIPFIFLTSYADPGTLARVKETAPMGYIVKPFTGEQLYSTIEVAWAQRSKSLTPELDLDRINGRLMVPLSRREQEVLSCIYKGKNIKATAEALFISINTVKFHLKNMYGKFGVHNRIELLYRLQEVMKG